MCKWGVVCMIFGGVVLVCGVCFCIIRLGFVFGSVLGVSCI